MKNASKKDPSHIHAYISLKLTSRGRHMTGILTDESVGLEAAWEYLWNTLTGNSEDVSLDLSGDIHATSPLGVVCPTQAGHVGHAALMDVHHTVWRQAERKGESTHTFDF